MQLGFCVDNLDDGSLLPFFFHFGAFLIGRDFFFNAEDFSATATV
jgi:hypothetical protein